jgi:hypothetical protein
MLGILENALGVSPSDASGDLPYVTSHHDATSIETTWAGSSTGLATTGSSKGLVSLSIGDRLSLLGRFANRRLSIDILCLLQKLFLVFLDIIHGVCHAPAFVFTILAFGVSLRASRRFCLAAEHYPPHP